jgi:hypothetical protein
MEYNRIVAVTGLPGLYEVVNSKTDGAIVRSLEDKSTKFVSSRIHNLSHLESIEVYTVRENVTLSDVFSAMKENNTKLPDVKDNKALKTYFEKVFPDLDFDRVYSSDMKKMIKWFEVLKENEVDFTAKPAEEEEEEPAMAEAEAPAKKAAKPKEAVGDKEKVKENEKDAPAKAKAPAKKTATAKKAAPKKEAPAKKKAAAKKK